MAAAFVTPNHPEISKIVNSASAIRNGWTGNPSFDAYQSLNPDRVKKQMAAIYEAIAALELIYCSPPASFEQEGQRIRMCDTIFSQKLATCIDISLLYTSCLEAIGLNPMGNPGELYSENPPDFKVLADRTFVAFSDYDASPAKAWIIENRFRPGGYYKYY